MIKRASSILLITICLLFIFAIAPVAAKDKWTKVQSKNFTLIGNGSEKDMGAALLG